MNTHLRIGGHRMDKCTNLLSYLKMEKLLYFDLFSLPQVSFFQSLPLLLKSLFFFSSYLILLSPFLFSPFLLLFFLFLFFRFSLLGFLSCFCSSFSVFFLSSSFSSSRNSSSVIHSSITFLLCLFRICSREL